MECCWGYLGSASWGRQVKKGKGGNDKNKLGVSETGHFAAGCLAGGPPEKPSSWSGPSSTSLRPCPASKLGRRRRKEGWLRSLHFGLFTNSTILLGHDTVNSL